MTDERRRIDDIARNATYVSGPADTPDDGVIALVTIKNGASYLDAFFDHHRRLGVRHFVFLDNDSTDFTTEYICNQADATLWRSNLPYRDYFVAFTRWLLETFGQNRWCLSIDIDELLEYPHCDRLNVNALTEYLDRNQWQAMRCIMLDMFPRGPLTEHSDSTSFRDTHRYFDPASIVTHGTSGALPIHERQHQYGIRRKAFGGNGDTFFLTKHPLIRFDRSMSYDHHRTDAPLAELTGVLLHYKFVGDFKKYVDESVEANVHWQDSVEYKLYKRALDENPNLTLFDSDAREYRSAQELRKFELVSIPESYETFAATFERSAS